jgi:hypothetical protein
MLPSKDVRVKTACGDVEHEFKGEPRDSTKLVMCTIHFDLWFEPRHVPLALWDLNRLHAFARIIGAQIVQDGKRHQAAEYCAASVASQGHAK